MEHKTLTDLLLCPLCGGKAKINGASIFGGLLNNLGIECQTCGLETRYGQFENKADLIAFWNTRPPKTSRWKYGITLNPRGQMTTILAPP